MRTNIWLLRHRWLIIIGLFAALIALVSCEAQAQGWAYDHSWPEPVNWPLSIGLTVLVIVWMMIFVSRRVALNMPVAKVAIGGLILCALLGGIADWLSQSGGILAVLSTAVGVISAASFLAAALALLAIESWPLREADYDT